ncbi:MAG: ubiquinone biosynthesis accessory factor UbiJ [Gammaproteobacteria bacterium]
MSDDDASRTRDETVGPQTDETQRPDPAEDSSGSRTPSSRHPLARLISLGFNRLLALDPITADEMRTLAGRCIALHVTGLNLTLYIQPHDDGVDIFDQPPADPDVTLSGSPFALGRMSLGRQAGSGLFEGAVQLRGNTGVGQRFQDILGRMEIDWEGELARYTGDIAAHQIGAWARGLADFGRRLGDKLGPDTGEYLSEEARLIVPAEEQAAFCDDVDTLRDDVDRLEARIKLLEQHTGNTARRAGPEASDDT